MKRQSQVLLAVAFVAAGAAGCFKDPVSNLRNGPAGFTVDHSAVVVRTGDSTAVTAYLLDNAGNQLAVTGATWTSMNNNVAVVRMDTTQAIPGAAYTKGFIRGIDSVSGGWTNVIVSARGIADTIRVAVIPSYLTSGHIAYGGGAAITDTVIIPANALAGTPAQYIQYSAPDTLVLNGDNILTFDTSKVAVSVATTNGTSKGFIVSKSPAQIKVMFMTGTVGPVMVNGMLMTPGNAKIGTIAIDTIVSTGDTVKVAPVRIGPALWGASGASANNIITVTAGPGMSFDTSTRASFAAFPATVVAQTATSVSFISTDTLPATAQYTVFNIGWAGDASVGTVLVDSLSSNVGPLSLNPGVLPAANVVMSPNNSKLGDTLIITAPAGMNFTVANDSTVSRALVGNLKVATSDTAWNVSITATTLKIFPKRGGKSALTVTNMVLPVAGAVPFSLSTPVEYTIDSINSDIPTATSIATAHPFTVPANDTAVLYGVLPPPGGFVGDFWTFTTTAPHVIFGSTSWFGSGNPYSTGVNTYANTEDIDFLLCDASTFCDESGAALASSTATRMPEYFTSASLPAGQYWLGVLDFNVDYSILYQTTIVLK